MALPNEVLEFQHTTNRTGPQPHFPNPSLCPMGLFTYGLTGFQAFDFLPPLILYLQNLHVRNDPSVLGLCGQAVNLTGAGLSECTGTPDKSLRPTGARLLGAGHGITDSRTMKKKVSSYSTWRY